MAKVVLSSFAELEAYTGKEIGVSDYHTITQEQVNRFADATLDHQWIHTDPERAAKESPFGTTIAHGYLTLSMAPYLLSQILELKNIKMGINYGMEKLRFLEPVKVGSKLRIRAELIELKDLRGTARMTLKMTFETEGSTKAAAVGEVIYLYQFA
ncbi:MaoC family dehydratase [Leptospira stimsonii]|uniref:Acyl dehydratase n=1 Tax=Leptospira stimsonii TaxID=2202203 RepID=A0A4R9L5G1_9LEPT|nr:MaoC family dehydratase [Leptospira stimsonii]RHX84309.1 acyl dehydratase [Leptospira stimsonii]RHX88728.1 acyl dehydratase [Leptospira stimsonii]TGK26133.1 MaoC family dehydratase [Leptospira stimsonii]TGM14962.1 MaoC family dehydratase [Leptospira stimsonii]